MKKKRVSVKKSIHQKKMPGKIRPPSNNFFNRELSWLEFNDRVLYQAQGDRHPLFERLKFINIFTSNLDEFYMKRVGGLKDQASSRYSFFSIDNLTPSEQIFLVRQKILGQLNLVQRLYETKIVPALKKEKICLVKWNDLNLREKEKLNDYFLHNLYPILTPLAVDFGHPFPFVSNLSKNIGILMRRPQSEETVFSRIKIPEDTTQWVSLNDSDKQELRLINVSEIILHNIQHLFQGMEIENVILFRVTRSALWNEDDEDAEDLLELVEEGIKERKFSPVIRLEHEPLKNKKVINILKDELEITDSDLYEVSSFDYLTSFKNIYDIERPQLKNKIWAPVIPTELLDESANIFQVLKQKDLLIHHPYESFNTSVERFILAAAKDPSVVAIKITLYRTDKKSRIIRSLIQAAEAGKQVACVIELKARFDEERNIHWANQLIKVGVHVVHGMPGLKTHSKMALVVRKEQGGIATYAHIGTGNYNSLTSMLYTDYSFITSKKKITQEVIELFNFLTGYSLKKDYKHLLIAPINMRENFLKMIKKETTFAKRGRIVAKMNSLEDSEIIQALYHASQAGVKIDLIVRGFCCLKPQVQGLSENIRVISIIGRFLEHSRVFYFGNDAKKPEEGKFYLGSADWMYRNLSNRVEVTVPIDDPSLKKNLWEDLKAQLDDKVQSWELNAFGKYHLAKDEGKKEGVHQKLMKKSLQRKNQLA